MLNKLIKYCSFVAFGLWFTIGCYEVWHKNFSQDAWNEHIYQMYKNIMAQTGQVQNAIPFRIDSSDIMNAYTNGEEVVLYQGLIDKLNEDEIALVIGHEIAHQMLGHVNLTAKMDDAYRTEVLEANADKLGAVYMMKAGYDICKGREFWKKMEQERGNSLGQDHPDYSYRYAELNINC